MYKSIHDYKSEQFSDLKMTCYSEDGVIYTSSASRIPHPRALETHKKPVLYDNRPNTDSFRFFIITIIVVLLIVACNVFFLCIVVVRDIYQDMVLDPATTSNNLVILLNNDNELSHHQSEINDPYIQFTHFAQYRSQNLFGYPSSTLYPNFTQVLIDQLDKESDKEFHMEALHQRIKRLNCHDIDQVLIGPPIASGWTKDVYQGRWRGQEVAIKLVSVEGHDMTACMEGEGQDVETRMAECYTKSATKFLRELTFLILLRHTNLIELKGFCVPSDKPGYLMSITELGQPLDLVHLLQISWENRLKIMQDLTKLLVYLSDSPLGSLVLNDFRRQQFVLLDRPHRPGCLKLSDLDDLGTGDKECSSGNDCIFTLPHGSARLQSRGTVTGISISSETSPKSSSTQPILFSLSAPQKNIFSISNQSFSSPLHIDLQTISEVPLFKSHCQYGNCKSWNERANIVRASNQFASFLLNHGAPHGLSNQIATFSQSFSWQRITAYQLDKHLTSIISSYTRGSYLNFENYQLLKDYTHVSNHDTIPAMTSHCVLVVEGHGCRIAVFNEAEAALYCSMEPECFAFVISGNKSWSNHRFAELRKFPSVSLSQQPKENFYFHDGYQLYYKTSLTTH